jgi:catechol 2,3-dioxygenase
MASVLHPAAHIGTVTLAVADMSRAVDFYTRVLGLALLDQQGDRAVLGAGSVVLLYLHALSGAQRQPPRTTGLYHAAILLPTRPDLGRVLLNLTHTRYPVSGFADHLVSEAVYLDDPDGNGLELYRDRPREMWVWEDGKQVRMASEPLDFAGILAETGDPDAPFVGMPAGTVIGHIHLRVGDIEQTETFYCGVIGFDVVARWHGALFISAGGYHHHLGLNTWQSQGASRPPENAVGLREFSVVLPDSAAQRAVVDRLDAAGIPHQPAGTDFMVDDPWGNTLRLARSG